MNETAAAGDGGGGGTVIVAGSLTVPPDKVGELMAAAVPMMQATRAEDGCLDYVFVADPLDAGCVRVYERWRSAAALEAHFGTPHMAEFQQVLRGIGVRGTDLARYEVASVGPVFGGRS